MYMTDVIHCLLAYPNDFVSFLVPTDLSLHTENTLILLR